MGKSCSSCKFKSCHLRILLSKKILKIYTLKFSNVFLIILKSCFLNVPVRKSLTLAIKVIQKSVKQRKLNFFLIFLSKKTLPSFFLFNLRETVTKKTDTLSHHTSKLFTASFSRGTKPNPIFTTFTIFFWI